MNIYVCKSLDLCVLDVIYGGWGGSNNWMAWCKTNVSDNFKPWQDFPLQTALNMLIWSFFIQKIKQESQKKVYLSLKKKKKKKNRGQESNPGSCVLISTAAVKTLIACMPHASNR